MNSFVNLFRSYGFTVEETGENSYIADNGTFCVPFSVHRYSAGLSDISAVSFLSCEKETIKRHYGNQANLGYAVFGDWFNGYLKRLGLYQHGPLCNHDHSGYEVELALRRLSQQPTHSH